MINKVENKVKWFLQPLKPKQNGVASNSSWTSGLKNMRKSQKQADNALQISGLEKYTIR